MSDILWWLREKNPIYIYARWRETYLSAHPEKRLFPWLFNIFDPQDSEAPDNGKSDPFISFTPEFEKKIGWGLVAVVAILALASRDS